MNIILSEQLSRVEKIYQENDDYDEYSHFGCEFILSCFKENINVDEVHPDTLFDFDDESANLFFAPNDLRGLLFDFSYLKRENKIVCYNGLCDNHNFEIVNTFSVDEFLQEYGLLRFYSCTNYKVFWRKLGYSWKN